MYNQVIDTLRDAYDQKVDERDAKDIAPWKAKERDVFLSHLHENHGEILHPITLLEIGAGTGKMGHYFQAQGLDVICTDLSPAMVDACRQKGLDARVMDFLTLEFEDSSFGAVFALNTLLHVPKADFDNVLRSISRVLKPNGLFYLGQYGGNDFEGTHEDDHYRPKRFFSHFTDEDIKEAVSQVYEILYFGVVEFGPKETGEKSYNFQSLILRKPTNENHTLE